MALRVHVVRLMTNHFNDQVVCLGSQMQHILEEIIDEVAHCVWFVADVDASQPLPGGIERRSPTPSIAGKTENLIDLAGKVDQFLSGIFLAVPEALLPISWASDYDTENPPTVEMGDVVVEIRTFDTSFFEVYARDGALLKRFSNRFSAPIEHA